METRFFNRKAHLIDYESFLEVMQEILDDSSLTIEKDYPRLSLYSAGYDSCYEDEEIMQRISNHLGVNIINYLDCKDQRYIYFMEDR